MSNTIVNTRAVCGRDLVVQQINISSDGSEETDLVVYDSSAVATALGKSDTLKSTIMGIQMMMSNTAGAATAAQFIFEYDATTDVPILPLSIPSNLSFFEADFSEYGGLVNTAGSGATGDILLTTTGLDASDIVTIILLVKPY